MPPTRWTVPEAKKKGPVQGGREQERIRGKNLISRSENLSRGRDEQEGSRTTRKARKQIICTLGGIEKIGSQVLRNGGGGRLFFRGRVLGVLPSCNIT